MLPAATRLYNGFLSKHANDVYGTSSKQALGWELACGQKAGLRPMLPAATRFYTGFLSKQANDVYGTSSKDAQNRDELPIRDNMREARSKPWTSMKW